jgi:peptide/nickel transport system substrate-binding protein
MRRFVAIIAAGVLAATACSDRGTVPDGGVSSSATLAPTTLASASTTAAPTTTTPPRDTPTSSSEPDVTLDLATPRYEGQVTIGGVEEPLTLNPYAPRGQERAVAVVGQAHLSGVYDVDPDTLELIPELAVAVPTVSNGGVVVNDDGSMDVTWDLLPEARWSDGRPVSGADLEFTLKFQEASTECSELGVSAPALPTLVEEETIVGDKSLTLRFETASLEHELLFRWVVPSHAVAESDYCLDWNTEMWPAAGPFVFAGWEREGENRAIRFTRNENYWKTDTAGNQLPYLDAVEFKYVSSAEELIGGFSEREFDVVSPLVSVGEIPVESWDERGADVQIVPGLIWEHLNFQFGPANRNPDSMNRYVEFRRAIARGIDRRALLDAAGADNMEVLDGFLTRFTAPASSQPWSAYSHDLDEARRLVSAACEQAARDCSAEPPRVVYSTTSNADFRPAVAELLAIQLAAVGIDVALDLEDSQIFFGDTVQDGTWDVGSWAWAGVSGSAGIVEFFDRFDPAVPRADSRSFYNWGTPGSSVEADEAVAQFDILLARMRSTTDAPEVFLLARQAEELLADQVVVIPLGAHPTVGAVWADEIQGYRMNPSVAGHTWNIEHWYRVGE